MLGWCTLMNRVCIIRASTAGLLIDFMHPDLTQAFDSVPFHKTLMTNQRWRETEWSSQNQACQALETDDEQAAVITGQRDNVVSHLATCLARWPAKQPLKSVLLCIFHPVNFPVQFCSSLSQWLFQGEIAISTSRCTSMIAMTPIPSVQSQNMPFAFWLIKFYLWIGPNTPAHSLPAGKPINHQNLTFSFSILE